MNISEHLILIYISLNCFKTLCAIVLIGMKLVFLTFYKRDFVAALCVLFDQLYAYYTEGMTILFHHRRWCTSSSTPRSIYTRNKISQIRSGNSPRRCREYSDRINFTSYNLAFSFTSVANIWKVLNKQIIYHQVNVVSVILTTHILAMKLNNMAVCQTQRYISTSTWHCKIQIL